MKSHLYKLWTLNLHFHIFFLYWHHMPGRQKSDRGQLIPIYYNTWFSFFIRFLSKRRPWNLLIGNMLLQILFFCLWKERFPKSVWFQIHFKIKSSPKLLNLTSSWIKLSLFGWLWSLCSHVLYKRLSSQWKELSGGERGIIFPSYLNCDSSSFLSNISWVNDAQVTSLSIS